MDVNGLPATRVYKRHLNSDKVRQRCICVMIHQGEERDDPRVLFRSKLKLSLTIVQQRF